MPICKKSKKGENPLERENVINCIDHFKRSYPKDKIIIFFHWNYELEINPMPMHKTLAKEAIDHGAEIVVGHNLVEKVPDEIEDIHQAAFGALGGIALEGIHQAEVVSGETVAVIGLGLLGHIVSRILYAYGCDVIGFDVADKAFLLQN